MDGEIIAQLKDCIDPNGILAPGRGGIWPKNLRHERFVNNKRDALRMKEGKENEKNRFIFCFICLLAEFKC